MARAKAHCTCERCGKEFIKIAYRQNSTAARDYEKWAEENITICPDCWKAEQDAKAVAGLNLPELTGSPKQIAWAEDIRAKMLRKAREATKPLKDDEKNLADECIRYIAEGKAESRFWIDNRDNNFFRLPEVKEFVKQKRA